MSIRERNLRPHVVDGRKARRRGRREGKGREGRMDAAGATNEISQ